MSLSKRLITTDAAGRADCTVQGTDVSAISADGAR